MPRSLGLGCSASPSQSIISETPGRDIIGGFVWIAIPGLGLLAGAKALYRFGHNLAATVVLSAMWLASDLMPARPKYLKMIQPKRGGTP